MDASFQVVNPVLRSPGRHARFAATSGKILPLCTMAVTWRHEFRRLQSESPQPPEQFVWFKPTGPVPQTILIAACLLVFES